MAGKVIPVSSPFLPPLHELIPYLEDIWSRRWLTNNGHYHALLEAELRDFLEVPYLSLFANGTLALLAALRALEITGEVITTPFSFVATAHALKWANAEPVFADIDPGTYNLDPKKIEAAITSRTTAIVPVHVYGTPCDVQGIGEIAARHRLKVVYDAAHAFAVRERGNSLLLHGDLSILSFHATKVFSTIEGGAIVCHSAEMKKKIDAIKNFGIQDEVTVVEIGINAKLNEVQSAYGLLCLKHYEEGLRARRTISDCYRRGLHSVRGVSCLPEPPRFEPNFSYFPVFVDESVYGHSRDALYERLKDNGVQGRRYFYPLISDFSMYRHLPSSARENLVVAARAADQVICLPMHAAIEEEDASRIVELLRWQEQ